MSQPIASFSPDVLALQINLIFEEYTEFIHAHHEAVAHLQNYKAREPLAKALGDLIFVCFQYAAAAGIDLDAVSDRIYESNMSKLVDGKPIKNSDGKVMKGPNYEPPFLTDCV